MQAASGLGRKFIPARTVIWGAGVQASPAKDWLGAEADRARIKGGGPQVAPFRYRKMGNLAAFGRNAEIIAYGLFKMKGWLACRVWGIAHMYFLIGTQARMFVALSWLWKFLFRQNSARRITQKMTLKGPDATRHRAVADDVDRKGRS